MKNYVQCPKCGSAAVNPVNFTWWGGALGPRLLSQVKCSGCQCKYNGKTGKSSTTGVLIYLAISFVIAFCVMFGFFVVRAMI